MTYEELRDQLNNLTDDELKQDVVIVSYEVNDGASTTDVQLGDLSTTELFIGAWFY